MSNDELKTITKSFQKNLDYLKTQLGVEPSYDVFCHEMIIGGKQAALFVIQGFPDTEVLSHILRDLSSLKREDIIPNTLEKLKKMYVAHYQLDFSAEMDKIIDAVLMGQSVLIISRCNQLFYRFFRHRQPVYINITQHFLYLVNQM